MSRSGYSDDMDDQWALIRWRGAVHAASVGKRGQALFRDLLTALDALPEPKLIAHELESDDGNVCALGALGKARQIDMSNIDPEDNDGVATVFNVAAALAREVAYMNDEYGPWKETPEQRFTRIRHWVARQITQTPQ